MTEAIEAFKAVSAAAEFKERERLRSRARHNEASALGHAHDKGMAKGIRKGRAEGRAEGLAKVARTALSQNMPVRSIAKLTGLSVAEVKNLAGAGN